MSNPLDAEFDWQRCPDAAELIARWVGECVDAIPMAAMLASRMMAETGTRLVDWVDHLGVPASDGAISSLAESGFVVEEQAGKEIWSHPGGLFPRIRVGDDGIRQIALQVDSVADFMFAHRLDAPVQGRPMSPLRLARVDATAAGELWVIERHGATGFSPLEVTDEQIVAALEHGEQLDRRRRDFRDCLDGFAHAADLARAATVDLGVDWACDLFFAAERRYWQSRNRAARVQKRRQDRLGLGWANHDHHTYRSSREYFTQLIDLLEQLGFQCRERFYGGAEAGWGAQVLEQSSAGVVIFADVDLSPTEVTGDFAHQGLAKRDSLGTVGLWCRLHGEAVMQAGMHHLECQFDFDAARRQLAEEGIETMAPFTDMEHLKQAFTKGQRWQVADERIDEARRQNLITESEAQKFRTSGSIGSHLEILQRDDGYKGFNQSGISEIIRETDPRHALKS